MFKKVFENVLMKHNVFRTMFFSTLSVAIGDYICQLFPADYKEWDKGKIFF
jgi:hypothetical protein